MLYTSNKSVSLNAKMLMSVQGHQWRHRSHLMKMYLRTQASHTREQSHPKTHITSSKNTHHKALFTFNICLSSSRSSAGWWCVVTLFLYTQVPFHWHQIGLIYIQSQSDKLPGRHNSYWYITITTNWCALRWHKQKV